MSRKSLANIVLDAQVLGENDDEAERLVLRHNSEKKNATSNSTSSNRRHSLGLSCLIQVPVSEMKDHIRHCIKLNSENKISVKNAFTLEMIDFMSFIVSKQQDEIVNLQVASVELDVCTKIYTYRVDGVHKDILKIAGGLDKQEKNIENAPNEEALCENEEMQLQSQVKKKKKNKQKICTTESALKACVETSHPLQSIIGSGDLCSTDMLYQATLPIHANSGFYYHQYNDVILDTVDDITVHEKNSSEYTIASIEDCTNLDICPHFSDFKFLNWSCEEVEDVETNEENNETRFQFDLDASIPAMEEVESKPINYFDIPEDEDNVNLCMRNQEQVENIVDLRNIVKAQVPELHKPLEYSFLQKHCIHWAGPSYWKIRTFGKVLSNSKVVETCHQVGLKKKKAIVLEYNDNTKSAVEQYFMLVQAAKIQYRTTTPKSWKETKTTLPEDVHYDDSQLNKVYIYPSITLSHSQNEDQLKMTQLTTDEYYNYNTENDMSNYCHEIDINNEEIQGGNELEELRTEDKNMEEHLVAFVGNNLIAPPKLTQKIVVPYAVRAKKIDMRQLKQTIWKSLTSESNKEKENTEKPEFGNADKMKESKPLSMVYKSLPSMLSKTNTEALSIAVTFVSLLHLANEKSLNLSAVSDLSDITINED